MHVVRNIRKGFLVLGRGLLLKSGEEREVSSAVVARLRSKRGTAAWEGKFFLVDPKPVPVVPVSKPPTQLETRVRRSIDLLVAAAVGRAPAVEKNAEPEGVKDLSKLRVPEAVALIAMTSDEDVLLSWASDPRKGVQEALSARLAELDAGEATPETTPEGGAGAE